MWQVLLAAAAAAGSGILAKKLINPIDTEKPVSDFKGNGQIFDQNNHLQHKGSIFNLNDAIQGSGSPENGDGQIFRFSSPESGFKESKKKGCRSGFKKISGSKKGKENGLSKGSGSDEDQRANRSGKKVSVCLKKRRTGKYVAAGKCGSCSSSKDNSFGWGVGVGVMYMMSTGKAEISRLNCAMDETARVVQELKAEISRRKSMSFVHVSDTENEAEANKKYTDRNHSGYLFTKLNAKRKDKNKPFGPMLTEEGECASSVPTEEQHPEVLEMDQLEAELEFELQKLPWCATESSHSDGKTDILEARDFAKEHPAEDLENSNLYPYSGVVPAELDKKLSRLLIEQQESQIVELEEELNQAHSKLNEKEAELRALKDCVKRLTEFSLAAASDEETDDLEVASYGIKDNQGFESTGSTVGMKRSLSRESYIYPTK